MKTTRILSALLGLALLAPGTIHAQNDYYNPNARPTPVPANTPGVHSPAEPPTRFEPSQGPPIRFSSPYDRYVTFGISAMYGVGLPMGSQANYIDRMSPANLVVQGEWLFPKRFSVGLKTGYQYSQQDMGRRVVDFGNGQTISAVQTRTFTVIPVMATAAYYFAENAAALRPYVQLSGGGAFVDYSNFYGTLVDRSNGFRGAIAPAVGVKLFGGRSKGLGGQVQAEYQNLFFRYNEINNSQNLLLSAGITYRWW